MKTKRRCNQRSADVPTTNREPVWESIREAWGDMIDPTEYLMDEPGWGGQNVAAYLVSREHGANAPAFSTDQELANIRGAARIICDVSVNAKCAMQNLGNYVVGQGFSYTVVDKLKVRQPDAKPSPLAVEAETVVDEFLTRTKYGTARRRKRLLLSQRRDGEFFIGLWHIGQGKATYRVADPGYFITPQRTDALDQQYDLFQPADWTFGIHTPADDYEDRRGFFAQYSPSPADFEYFLPDRMVHSRINVDDAVKRGLSDFYWVYTGLQDAAKLLRNGIRGAAALAAIAGIVEHPAGQREESITSFKTGSAVSSYRESTQRGGRTNYTHRYNPGSMVHVPSGTLYKPSPLASQGVAGSIVELEQAVLRVIGSNWCMPEYMISSDASNANYSSTLVAGAPFIKFVEALQGDCAEEDEELLWKVLAIAHKAGKFADGVPWEQVVRDIEVKVESPQAGIADEEKESRVNQVLFQAGLLSDRTWAAKAGLDWDQEKANGAERTQETQPVDATEPIAADQPPNQSANMAVEASQGLNGARVTSALELMLRVSAGEIAKATALELLVGIGIEQSRAERMITAQSGITVQPKPEDTNRPEQLQPAASRMAEAARLLWGDYPDA